MPSDFTQLPFVPDGETAASLFADNPGPFCPCVLLLDTSSSMGGKPIAQLNEGLRTFRDELSSDPLSAKRVEVAVVSFGPVTADVDFIAANSFLPPTLKAGGDTPMGRAVLTALDMVQRRKAEYREHGIAYYRPWIFLVTDGAPTDAWTEAASRIRAEEEAQRVAFFAVGVAGADLAMLARLAVRTPLPLQGLNFRDMFLWLSGSLRACESFHSLRYRNSSAVACGVESSW